MRNFIFLFMAMCCLCGPATAGDSAYQNALRLLSEGRIEEARESLQSVIDQQPEHAGAWLDLAILQCGMGLADEAEALFRKILERFDPPQAIQELIRRIQARGCAVPVLRQESSRLLFKLGRGYDSNVNQGASNPFSLGGLPLAPEFRPRGDSFLQYSLEATHNFSSYGTLFYTQIQSRQHDHISRYNLTTALAVVEQPLRLGTWNSRLGLSLSAAQLGGHLYQKQGGVYAQVSPPWPVLPNGWRYSFISDWSRVWYPTLDHFDSHIARNQLTLNFQDDDTQFMGSVGVTQDFGQKNRPGGDKHGWIANLLLRQRLGARLYGEVSGARQEWRGDKIYFAGLIDTNTKREQRTSLWRVAAVYALTPKQNLTLEYKHMNNRENISLFSYRSRQVMLNWQYDFSN
ncbi:hypothetical protein AGMMS50256_29490 [Betaproteobacteria bacterium]|nr:hypothetical protein AGMMS50256_29490 [Betaproteobacteria bacterium]